MFSLDDERSARLVYFGNIYAQNANFTPPTRTYGEWEEKGGCGNADASLGFHIRGRLILYASHRRYKCTIDGGRDVLNRGTVPCPSQAA